MGGNVEHVHVDLVFVDPDDDRRALRVVGDVYVAER
jgi:hypothetical protein